VTADPAPHDLLQRTARGAGWVLAWRLGMRALGLISTLVLVRLIAPADFGIIALASGFSQTIDGMLSFGTEEIVIREPNPDRRFYDTAFTLNLIRGLFVSVVVAALAFPAANFFSDARLGPVLLLVACLPALDGCANIGAVDFRRNFAFKSEFALMVLPKACGIVAAIGAAVLTRSYVAMLVGMGVNRSMRVVMTYAMHPYRPRLCLQSWRKLAGYSAWTWVLSMAILLRERCDSFVVGRVINSSAVGFYTIANEIAALPTTELIEPLGRAAFSGFTAGHRGRIDLASTYLRLIACTAVLALPTGMGLSSIAAPLVALAFGNGWDAAIPALRILALGFTALTIGHLSQHLLSAYALLGRLTGITVCGATLRIALLVALTPSFGLEGAATGVALSVTLEQILIIFFAMRRLGITAAAFFAYLWRPIVATVTMSGVLAATGLGWTMSTDILSMGFAIAAGVIAYALTIVATWFAAGRPQGAESDVYTLTLHIAKRITKRIPPGA